MSEITVRNYKFVAEHILSQLWKRAVVKVSRVYLTEVLWLLMLGHIRIVHTTGQHVFVYLNPEGSQ